MPEISPFQGHRYDTSVAGEMRKLIAPPYDVIDDAMRDTLFRLSKYNIARITRAARNEGENPYSAAGELWRQWRREGVVKKDAAPSLYVYEQYFNVNDRKYSRTAVIGRVRLQEPGTGVLPHENTLIGPRVDRLELTRATETQFGQVFSLYSDNDRMVDKLLEQAKRSHPLFSASDRTDLLHRLWAITDPAVIGRICELLRDRELLIADGHHRYETALAYAAEHRDNPEAQWQMMTLVNMNSEGLVILPTHRLVKNVMDFAPAAFLSRLKRRFEIKSYPGDTATVRDLATHEITEAQGRGEHAFGLFLNDGIYRVLILRDDSSLREDDGHSAAWRNLDVAILHQRILEEILGITQDRLSAQSNIEYVHDFRHEVDAAAERVSNGECQALFLMNPTRADEVQTVARNKERMPQKSTFFYPKIYSGMVFYCLTDNIQ